MSARTAPCPNDCECLCHDTGYTMQHGENGRCPTKDGWPLVPLDMEDA